MADLTTTDGTTIHFSPSSIAAVLDTDPNTGAAVTTILGLTSGRLLIAETVDGFLTRIGEIGNFATLTRADGGSILINAKSVKLVRPPVADEYAPQIKAVVAVGGLTLPVQQTPAAAKAAIVAKGGTI